MERIGSYETLIVEREDGIVQLTLNRPDRLNAMNDRMLFVEIPDAVAQIAADESIRAVIMTGAGRGFCAGREVAEIARRAGEPERRVIPEPAGREVKFIGQIEVPIIAAVNGPAAGAGFGVALLADFRIAAESAVFLEAHVQRGLSPSIASWYLPRMVGLTRAMEMILLGDRISAQDALSYGLVNKVVPNDQLLPEAWKLAQRLAELPPFTVRIAKQTIYRGLSAPLDSVREFSGWSQVLGRLLTNEQAEASQKFLKAKGS